MRRLSVMAGSARSAPILLFCILVAFAHAKLIDMRVNLGGEAVDGFAAEEEVLDVDENFSKMRYHGEIKGGADHMNVFRTQRFSRGEDLLINIPVPDGIYTVTLLFAETWKGTFGPGKRVFDVYLGSKPGGIVKVLDQFDPFKSGGPASAVRRKFEYIATQGGLTIALRPIVQNPQIAGVMVQGYSYSSALIDELPTVPAPTGGNEDFSVISGIGPRVPSDPSLIYDAALNPKLRKNMPGSSSSVGGSMSSSRSHSDMDPMANTGMGAPPPPTAPPASMNSYQPPGGRSQHSPPMGQFGSRSPPSHTSPSTGGPPLPPLPPRGYGYGSGQSPTSSGGPSQGYGQGGGSSYSSYSGADPATHGYSTTQYGGYGHHAVYRRRLNSIPEADGLAGMPPPPDMFASNGMGNGQPLPGAFPPGPQDFPQGVPDSMAPQQAFSDPGVVRSFEHNPFSIAPSAQQGPPFPEHPDQGGMPSQDMHLSGPAAEFNRNQMDAALAAQHDSGAAQQMQQMPPSGLDPLSQAPPGMEMPQPPVSNPFEMAPPVPAGGAQGSDGGVAAGMHNNAFDNNGAAPASDLGVPSMDHQVAPVQQAPADQQNNYGAPDMVAQHAQPPLDPAMHAQSFEQQQQQQQTSNEQQQQQPQPVAEQLQQQPQPVVEQQQQQPQPVVEQQQQQPQAAAEQQQQPPPPVIEQQQQPQPQQYQVAGQQQPQQQQMLPQQPPQQRQQPVVEEQQRIPEQPEQLQTQGQQQVNDQNQQPNGQQQATEQSLQAPSQPQQPPEQQQQAPEQVQQATTQTQQAPEQKLEAPTAQQPMAHAAALEQGVLAQPPMQQLSTEQPTNAQPATEPAPPQQGTDSMSAQSASAQNVPAQSVQDHSTSTQSFGQAVAQPAGDASLPAGNSLSAPAAPVQQIASSDGVAQNNAGVSTTAQDHQSVPAAGTVDSTSVPQNTAAQPAPAAIHAVSAQPARFEAQQAATQPQAAQPSTLSTASTGQVSYAGGAAQNSQQVPSGVAAHREFQAQSESLQRVAGQNSQPSASGETTATTAQSAPAVSLGLSQFSGAAQATTADPQNAAVSGTATQLSAMQQPAAAQQAVGTTQTGQASMGSAGSGMTSYMNARAGGASNAETAVIQSQGTGASNQAQTPSSSASTGSSGAVGLQSAPSVAGVSTPGAPAADVPSSSDKFVTRTVSRTLTNPGGGIVGGNGMAPQGMATSTGSAQVPAQNLQDNHALRQVASMMNALRGAKVAGGASGNSVAATAVHQSTGGQVNPGAGSQAAVPNAQQVQGVAGVGGASSGRSMPSHDGTVRAPLEVAAAQTGTAQAAGASATGLAVAAPLSGNAAGNAKVSASTNSAAPGIVGMGDLDGLCLHNSTHCSCGMVESPKPEECLFVVNENEKPMICMRRPCSGKMVCACAPGANMLCRRTTVKTILVPSTMGKGKVSDFGSSDNLVLCKRETLDDGVNVYMPV